MVRIAQHPQAPPAPASGNEPGYVSRQHFHQQERGLLPTGDPLQDAEIASASLAERRLRLLAELRQPPAGGGSP